jgi:ubiquinone/menaquinone biosynthesis C-methylase UbiE
MSTENERGPQGFAELNMVPELDSTEVWESAYVRFETPEQEIKKFLKRLQRLGVTSLPRDTGIVELFCGRGNGLHALSRLGFTNLEGVDFSARLVALYTGPATCLVCDCRHLPFPDQSKKVLIVQGGLHHLPTLPDSLDQTFSEMHRVLRKDGLLVVVEPWMTSFLRFVHWVSDIRLVRRLSDKLDAFAVMREHERRTYEQWLNQPKLVLDIAHSRFAPVQESFAWGKWLFVGRPL